VRLVVIILVLLISGAAVAYRDRRSRHIVAFAVTIVFGALAYVPLYVLAVRVA
jgi:hypothetical protein